MTIPATGTSLTLTYVFKNRKDANHSLLQFAMEQTLNWSDTEKERISKAMKSLDAEIKKQSYNLDFPKEIIFVKTTQKEEGNAEAYTRVNWIAIGEHALKEAFGCRFEIPCSP